MELFWRPIHEDQRGPRLALKISSVTSVTSVRQSSLNSW